MESSDYTRLDYKTINEFFPKGQLSILAAGTFGNHHQEYPYELWEIKDAINGIIDNIGYIINCINETELLKSNR